DGLASRNGPSSAVRRRRQCPRVYVDRARAPCWTSADRRGPAGRRGGGVAVGGRGGLARVRSPAPRYPQRTDRGNAVLHRVPRGRARDGVGPVGGAATGERDLLTAARGLDSDSRLRV